MDELCTYQIAVRNGMDAAAFNAASPLQIRVVRVEPDATFFTMDADQSGVIGLLRHLHQQGFLLLSLRRERRKHI